MAALGVGGPGRGVPRFGTGFYPLGVIQLRGARRGAFRAAGKVVPSYNRLAPPPASRARMAGIHIALICAVVLLVVAIALLAMAVSRYGWKGDKGHSSFAGRLRWA